MADRWISAPQHSRLVAQQGARREQHRLGDHYKVVGGLGDGAVDLAFGGAHDRQKEQRAEDDP